MPLCVSDLSPGNGGVVGGVPLTPGTTQKMTTVLQESFRTFEKEQQRLNIPKGQYTSITVRRSGLGVVSWTCDPVLALGQRFDSHSRRSFCCNPLG